LTNKFALTGLSNSANAVLFYDKGVFEARTAVNWRDHFLQYLAPPPLNGAGQAVTQVRSRYQLDASATYHINKNFGVFVEGENLTNQYLLKYAYYQNQFLSAEDSGRRWKIGVRANSKAGNRISGRAVTVRPENSIDVRPWRAMFPLWSRAVCGNCVLAVKIDDHGKSGSVDCIVGGGTADGLRPASLRHAIARNPAAACKLHWLKARPSASSASGRAPGRRCVRP